MLNVDGTCDTCKSDHYSTCTCVSLVKIGNGVAELWGMLFREPSEITDLPSRVELNPLGVVRYGTDHEIAAWTPLVAS